MGDRGREERELFLHYTLVQAYRINLDLNILRILLSEIQYNALAGFAFAP